MLTDNEVKSGRRVKNGSKVFCLEQLEEYISHYGLGRHQEEPFQTGSPFRKEALSERKIRLMIWDFFFFNKQNTNGILITLVELKVNILALSLPHQFFLKIVKTRG